ncbi:hypothetical protein [Microbacterium sp. NPDC086615]|uniref:hypothetical protein n=1 Tax=Microbacterium sp. NPDC086615 TaxID=3154865 RepID=UPI003426BDE2
MMVQDADVWRKFSFDYIDDPELEILTARIVNQKFIIDGKIDWAQAYSLDLFQVGGRAPERRRKRRPREAPTELSVPIRLVVPFAQSFDVQDRAKIGIIVPERFEYETDRVEIVGLMECDITVWVTSSPDPYFELGPLESGITGS